MRKPNSKSKPKPKQDQEWFRQQVAELGRALKALPGDRQVELERHLAEKKNKP